jgi:hypothetical protein
MEQKIPPLDEVQLREQSGDELIHLANYHLGRRNVMKMELVKLIAMVETQLKTEHCSKMTNTKKKTARVGMRAPIEKKIDEENVLLMALNERFKRWIHAGLCEDAKVELANQDSVTCEFALHKNPPKTFVAVSLERSIQKGKTPHVTAARFRICGNISRQVMEWWRETVEVLLLTLKECRAYNLHKYDLKGFAVFCGPKPPKEGEKTKQQLLLNTADEIPVSHKSIYEEDNIREASKVRAAQIESGKDYWSEADVLPISLKTALGVAALRRPFLHKEYEVTAFMGDFHITVEGDLDPKTLHGIRVYGTLVHEKTDVAARKGDSNFDWPDVSAVDMAKHQESLGLDSKNAPLAETKDMRARVDHLEKRVEAMEKQMKGMVVVAAIAAFVVYGQFRRTHAH